jgi:hypothetical protein
MQQQPDQQVIARFLRALFCSNKYVLDQRLLQPSPAADGALLMPLLLQETAGNMLEGLHFVLRLPAISTEPRQLCTAALVSRGWRQAVQHCDVCNTAVLINAAAPMARLQGFAQWLAGHAGLVSSLEVVNEPGFISDNAAIGGPGFDDHLSAAEELLLLSIHAAGAPPAAGDSTRPAATSTAAAAAVAVAAATGTGETAAGSSQQQHGLRLRSFSSSLPNPVDMLAALQVQHLTRVELSFPGRCDRQLCTVYSASASQQPAAAAFRQHV